MELKKAQRNNRTISIIKTDRFKSINVSIFFCKKVEPVHFEALNLLYKNMIDSTRKYNTKTKFNNYLEYLYGTEVTAEHTVKSGLETILFNVEFIHPKYTEESMYKLNLDLLKEIIFNPIIEETKFNIIRKNITSNIISSLENPVFYSSLQYKSLMFKGTSQSISIVGDLNNYENITSSTLCKYYKTLFTDYDIKIIVVGNIENEDFFINYFEKLFKGMREVKINPQMYYELNNSKLIVKKDSKEFNQSQLIVGYKFHNLTDYERKYVLTIYNTILGVINNSILFTKLREDNSLCYSVNSNISNYYASLTITSAINKDNYDLALSIIKECVKNMLNKKQVSYLFDSAKKTIKTVLNGFYDDTYTIAEHYLMKEFDDVEEIEIRKEKLLNVSVDEIIALNKKIKLSVVYFLEGTLNEKNSNE